LFLSEIFRYIQEAGYEGNMEIECDVLVVGGGPAGSVAALYSSKHGLNTVLIERDNRIGARTNTRIDSSPDFGLTEIIKEIGLKTENLVYNSKWHSPSGSSFTLHSKIGEYYFKRGSAPDSFESSTAYNSMKYGCELFLDANLKSVNTDNKNQKCISEVIVSQGLHEMIIKPKIIIDAAGENAPFHTFLRIPKRDYKKGVIFGMTGKDFVSSDTSEIYFDAALIKGGYFYMITAKNGISSAAVVLDSSMMRKPAEKYFYEYLRRHTEVAEKIKSVAGSFYGGANLLRLPEHVYQNVLFAGDAAGLIDPLMGYGMLPAIASGYYAGKYSVEAIKAGDYEALKKYEWEVRKRFNKKMSYAFRRIFESLDNKDLDMLIKMANELGDKTDVDDLMIRPSIPGLFHALSVFFEHLPSSGRLLTNGFKGII
jgi:digeranylgeranylglycerophospholipid reductase